MLGSNRGMPLAPGRRNYGWPAVVALLLIACAGCVSQSSLERATTLRCPDCPELQVTRVVDGDTFDTPSGRVRIFGIDTPERGERCYGEAKKGLKSLIGSTVRLEPGPRTMDSTGRLLYYAYTAAGNSVEEILVSAGLAEAWTRDGQHRDYLLEIERSARLSGAGCLW